MRKSLLLAIVVGAMLTIVVGEVMAADLDAQQGLKDTVVVFLKSDRANWTWHKVFTCGVIIAQVACNSTPEAGRAWVDSLPFPRYSELKMWERKAFEKGIETVFGKNGMDTYLDNR